MTSSKEKYQMKFFIGSKTYGGRGKGFVYFFEEHEELENVIDLLQSKSCVTKIATAYKGSPSQYRFNEWFAESLKRWKP